MSITVCPHHGQFDNRETQIEECPVCVRNHRDQMETFLYSLLPQGSDTGLTGGLLWPDQVYKIRALLNRK